MWSVPWRPFLAQSGTQGGPGDIAGLAVLLAGKAGAFITGQTLVADGGTTIGV
jgi:NAD(P)-dependent dehydrogenase (short-subunit alcohol dehydrogenase family)